VARAQNKLGHSIADSVIADYEKVLNKVDLASIDAREIYKLAFDKYKNDLKTYEDKRREINRNFKEAIDIALSDAKSAASGVKSQFQKRQSMSARQNAVIAAISIRDAAIEALGLPPVEPTPPAKAPKIERDKRPKPPISTATPQ
jgi:superfamily II RNA helicase